MKKKEIKTFKPLGQVEVEGESYYYDCYYTIDDKTLDIYLDFVNTHGSIDKRMMIPGLILRVYALYIQKMEQNIALDKMEYVCGAKCKPVKDAFRCLKKNPVVFDKIESFLKDKGYPNMHSFNYQINKVVFNYLKDEQDPNSIKICRNKKRYEIETNFNIDMVKDA